MEDLLTVFNEYWAKATPRHDTSYPFVSGRTKSFKDIGGRTITHATTQGDVVVKEVNGRVFLRETPKFFWDVMGCLEENFLLLPEHLKLFFDRSGEDRKTFSDLLNKVIGYNVNNIF